MTLGIELDREDDGRWLAEVPALSGVMCYGETREDTVARVQALALRVIADRLEHGETGPTLWPCPSRLRESPAVEQGTSGTARSQSS